MTKNIHIFRLIVTTGHGPIEKFLRFVNSVYSQHAGNYEILLFILHQNTSDNSSCSAITDPGFPLLQTFNFFTEKSYSLSTARNLLLRYSQNYNSDYTLFPDDDCYYPNDFFCTLLHSLSNITSDVVCLPVYDPHTRKFFGKRNLHTTVLINQFNIMILPISVGLVFKSSVVPSPLAFNPYFGAGALLGAGEETLLVYRLIYHLGCDCFFTHSPKVFHDTYNPESLSLVKVKEYSFATTLLAKYFLIDRYIIIPLLTHIFFGLYSLLKAFLSFKNKKKRNFYISRFKGVFSALFSNLPTNKIRITTHDGLL